MGLRFRPGTREYLATLAPQPRKVVRAALRRIAEDPRHAELDIKQLRVKGGTRVYRARVLDHYRIVYSPRAGHTDVWRIMHRSEGYDWLERMDPSDE